MIILKKLNRRLLKDKSLIINFLLHLHPARVPESSARFTYTFGLGGLISLCFIITAASGILLVFEYSPAPDSANKSMQYIATVSRYGWYIRNLHYWAAQVMVITAVLHMIRIVLTGGYLGGRAFNWVIGNILLIFLFFMDLTGYFLRWDIKSGYALVTGMNLIREIPLAGQFILSMVIGGPDMAENRLLHLYAWHIAGLPFILFLFMVYHIYRIRRDGGISSENSDIEKITIPREILLEREIIFILISLSALIILSAFFSPELGPSHNNDSVTYNINAPWIFLSVQFLLRYIEPFTGGIIIPFTVVLYWATLPCFDKSQQAQGIWFARERFKIWLSFLLSMLIIGLFSIAEILIE